jgi:hypothetical protein
MRLGKDMPAWLCRCDCGAELRVPNKRLTTTVAALKWDACETCRGTLCVICGGPIAAGSPRIACSRQECQRELGLARQRAYDAAHRDDPLYLERKRQHTRSYRASMTPEEQREAGRRKRQDEDIAARLERMAAWREKNRDHIRAYARERRRQKKMMAAAQEIASFADSAKDKLDAR